MPLTRETSPEGAPILPPGETVAKDVGQESRLSSDSLLAQIIWFAAQAKRPRI